MPEETRPTSQGQPGAGGGSASPGGPGETPQFLTAADLDRVLQERVAPLIERARDEGRREMQSRKDREIAERERMHQQRLEAQQGLYASSLRELGAGEEDLQQLQTAFQTRTQEMDERQELEYYRRVQQEQRAYEDTNRRIEAILGAAGVPRDHPSLDFSSEEAFLASVTKAKEQMWQQVQGTTEPGAPETPQQPNRQPAAPPQQPTRGQRGAADVLGGGAGIYQRPNPIEGRMDAANLISEGIADGEVTKKT